MLITLTNAFEISQRMCKQDVQPEKDAEMSGNVELHFSGGWAFFCLEINILGAAPLVGNMESRYRLGK